VHANIGPGGRAEKKLELNKLPPTVQKTIRDQSQGDDVKGITQETGKGRTQYEVETMRNGKHRDFLVDTIGITDRLRTPFLRWCRKGRRDPARMNLTGNR
jgi:hypothetical protein